MYLFVKGVKLRICYRKATVKGASLDQTKQTEDLVTAGVAR